MGERKALVVGINEYSKTPLRCCVNDATDMHAALQRMNFESSLLVNPDFHAFKRATRAFVASLNPGDIGFFYFAGHGAEAAVRQAGVYTSSNWLIARDMPDHRDDLPQFAIDAHNLLAEMEARRTRFNALVLDCCRDDPLPSGDRSARGGLASMDPKGSLVAFGCARGQTTAERRSGRNGIFTEHLLAHIEERGLDINNLFIRVGKAVEEATRGLGRPMVPYVNHSLREEGASLFPAPGSGPPPSRQQVAPAAIARQQDEQARAEAVERSQREAAEERRLRAAAAAASAASADEERARREAVERSRREAAEERQRQKRQREAAAQAPGMPMQMPSQHDPQMPRCAQGGRVQVVGLSGEQMFVNGQNGTVVSWRNGRGRVRIDTGSVAGREVVVHDWNVKAPAQPLLGRARFTEERGCF